MSKFLFTVAIAAATIAGISYIAKKIQKLNNEETANIPDEDSPECMDIERDDPLEPKESIHIDIDEKEDNTEEVDFTDPTNVSLDPLHFPDLSVSEEQASFNMEKYKNKTEENMNEDSKLTKEETSVKEVSNTEKSEESNKMFTVKCSECGKETTVPFKPQKDRPVYCQSCFERKKQEKKNKT